MSKKVTFTLPAEVVADATSGLLLGDFNNWDESKGAKLKKEKDGSYTATLSLEPGTYNYRYLLSDGRWVNDHTQSYAPAHGLHVENCVITVEVEEEKAPVAKAEPKAPAAKKAAPVKEEPAPKAAPAPAKKAAPKKAAPVAKAEPAPVKKAAPAKKAAPVKAAAPAPVKAAKKAAPKKK